MLEKHTQVLNSFTNPSETGTTPQISEIMTSSGPLPSQYNRHCRMFFPPCHTIKYQREEQGAPNYAQFHAHPAAAICTDAIVKFVFGHR